MKYLSIILTVFLVNKTTWASLQVSNLVEPESYFVNHTNQLQEIAEKLNSFKKVSVVGISGIGKTQIAKKYAANHLNDYKIIWFFDVNKDLNEQFSTLAQRINTNICSVEKCLLTENPQFSKNSVLDYLKSKSTWLLVFDNIQISNLDAAKEFTSIDHNGHIIFCTQNGEETPSPVYVPYLSNEDSNRIIKKLYTVNNEEIAYNLLKDSKGYPLLIARASMFLNSNKHLSYSEYKNLIKDKADDTLTYVELIYSKLIISERKLVIKMALINNQQFSKNLLKVLCSDDHLVQYITTLLNYGLIITRKFDNHNPEFEMHDIIKKNILTMQNNDTIQNNINELLDEFSKKIPKGVSNRYQSIASEDTLKSNLEELLKNADKYGADFFKILELRKNLLDYYAVALDYYNCEKMKEWLVKNEKEGKLNPSIMNDHQKTLYAWYLADIGMFEHFSKDNFIDSISYLRRAETIVKGLKGYPELHFTINAQIAQSFLFWGKTNEVQPYLDIVKNIIDNNKEAELDLGLYWFLEAKYALTQGDYSRALLAIDNNIEAEKHLPRDTFTAPTFIVKAEILNYMGKYNEALAIATKIYEQETKSADASHEIHGRILAQLSRANNGKENYTKALENAEKAINIYHVLFNLNSKNILEANSTSLAAAYSAKADALSSLDRIEESMEAYSLAETIYYNVYRENFKNMDDVGDMYYKASLTAYKAQDGEYWFNKFSSKLISQFGKNYHKSKEILEIISNSSFKK